MRVAVLFGVALSLHPSAAGAARAGAPVERRADAPAHAVRTRLEAAAIAAVRRDGRLAALALWDDRVPDSAAHTLVGQALEALRAAAERRRAERIRVRMLRSELRIVSVRLSAGGTAAEVVARWRQTLRVASLTGAGSGPPLSLDEEAALFLERPSRSARFVVSKVELLR
jgi:hypothetical protein